MEKSRPCSCCAHGEAEKTKCPVCGVLSPAVGAHTVRALLKKDAGVPAKGPFNICINPVCEVGYFTDGRTWPHKDAVVPFDFKAGVPVRYACYCNELTYEEAAKTVAKIGDADWAGVVKAVKGKVLQCKCAEKNPFGVCCSSNSFKSAVTEAKNGRKSE